MNDVSAVAGVTQLRRNSGETPVTLGQELGRGGEGAVFPVAESPDLVAKIYLQPPTPIKAEKLRSMAHDASPALLRVAAWPVDLLSDSAGVVRGFLMPKVSAREDVHELYSPKSRRHAFPSVDFRFVVRAATNIARAFAQVHAAGNVIGDVNHGNALVGHDGTVMLIDCDSFQVHDGARLYTCDVGVPLFTAPELAGHAFRGLERTVNHDAFGLAVLLFHLLYTGRHPFAGKHADGEMPIERAIAESRFVYGANAADLGMSRPPGTLVLDAFGDLIAQLFEQAFAPPGETPRPKPAQWIDALQELEARLAPCSVSPSHFFARRGGKPGGGDPGCCWCVLERHTGLQLFGKRRDTFDALGTAKLAPLWDAIMAVPPPQPAQPVELPSITDYGAESQDPIGPIPRAILSWLLVFLSIGSLLYQPGEHFVLAALTFGAAVALRWKHRRQGWRTERARATHWGLFSARKHLATVAAEWNELISDSRFENLVTRLSEVKQQLLELQQRRKDRMNALLDEGARLQRYRYLDGIALDKAKLPNVSYQEIRMLASFDIDTAAEVLGYEQKMRGLISEKARQEIIAWANACVRNFTLDPTRAVDPDAMHEIDEILHKEQESLLGALSKGQKELELLAGEMSADRANKQSQLDKARKAVDNASNQATQ